MSWELVVTGPARKSLERLPAEVRGRILKALKLAALSEIEQGNVKRMQGTAVLYRLRVGDYRVILKLPLGNSL